MSTKIFTSLDFLQLVILCYAKLQKVLHKESIPCVKYVVAVETVYTSTFGAQVHVNTL